MSEGISENTQLKANTAFVIKTVGLIITAVWGYSVVWNKIMTLENELARVKHSIELNSEFRVKWPRGELGSLPADAEQNMRLTHAEGRLNKIDEHVDRLRMEAATPKQ